jgi:hypothetical protein
MKSIVLELQEIAKDENVSITKLLRLALMVASKLNLSDFQVWINKELSGYKSIEEIPDYRLVKGEIKAWNPYNGMWVPFIWPDAPKKLYQRSIGQSISEIEHIFKKQVSYKNGTLTIPFSPDQQAIIIEKFEASLTPVLIIPQSSLIKILDEVRNIILKWSLKLEKEGILGEEKSFSNDEKVRAKNNQEIKIENFYGNLGNIFEGTIFQEINVSIQNKDLDSLLKYLGSKGIDLHDLEELKEAINNDPEPENKNKFGEKVSKWFGKMVSKASSGAWQISVNIATQVITNALLRYYGFI